MNIGGISSVQYYNYQRLMSGNTVDDSKVAAEQAEQNVVVPDNIANLLPDSQVIDYAVNADMNVDKSLIGSQAKLEGLDVQKAISDMQKDSILREYQYFVYDAGHADGFVLKKN